jgi:hypothetical protein
VVAIALVAVLAGCGGDPDPATTTAGTAADSSASVDLPRGELERQIGNAFDSALYRLAVLSQPGDDATDLGQDLPTGIVTAVRCSSDDSSCAVRWRTVSDQPRTTRYSVRVLSWACFTAAARPALADHRDPTIGGYSENPLNALVSTEERCS